ncbi:3-hydroxyacyl-CoA dehydrogenase family protein [Streptomyces sp. NPDC015220]|uniref:3-hydroxyacyl-CoA dehydrogenase family protein n=1 Tax=Streptomyces sp. NPDC015220 TaxID=3364947 RepID=UPI0036FC8975
MRSSPRRVLLECTGDDRFQPSDQLVRMVREGHLGRKSGRGFHSCVAPRRNL